MDNAGKLLFFLLFFTTIFTSVGFAQKKVKLVQAESLESGSRNGEKFNKVLHDVIFKQKTTTIYCDSAYFFKSKNYIEAFGRVKITEGDSIVVTGKKLIYDGDTKLAQMRQQVVFTDGVMILYTDFLDYDLINKQAYYFNKGKMVDSTNVLTSEKGYYDTTTKLSSFKKKVVLVNPEYTIKSDTLQYQTITKVAYFKGPTEIIAKDGSILNAQEGGQYNTLNEKSLFDKGEVLTEKYIIAGDRLFSDEINKLYTASKNVVMTAKMDNVIITGEFADYKKNLGITKVFGNPVLRKIDGIDTVFISADTLISIEGPGKNDDKLFAYNNVKIFKSNLQGIADSLLYNFEDSTIYLYNDPVLWNGKSQMTADSIHILLNGNKVDKMLMRTNSFVISQDTIFNFNQIKGRNMIAYFKDDQIHKVNVKGNGESLYYALEKDTITMGLNKIICSDMIIRFSDSKVDNISFYVNPDALFIPPHEIKDEDKKLKSFNWRKEERPDKEMVIYRKKRHAHQPEVHPEIIKTPGKDKITPQ
jgi:lipopolysaccharide export system protein LptA